MDWFGSASRAREFFEESLPKKWCFFHEVVANAKPAAGMHELDAPWERLLTLNRPSESANTRTVVSTTPLGRRI